MGKCAKCTEVRALKNSCQHCGCAYTELMSLDVLHSDRSLNFVCSVPRVPLPAPVLVRGASNYYRDLFPLYGAAPLRKLLLAPVVATLTERPGLWYYTFKKIILIL